MSRFWVALGTAALLLAQAGSASAGWNNVFQPAAFNHNGNAPQFTTTAHELPVIVNSSPVSEGGGQETPCPQKQCNTSYRQRCFYQPVTTYETKTFYEPTTTYRTSYYHEPITTYRTSMYVDPCTGACQQVVTPVTSYRLREQTCPVQSWVQRCTQVPVTTMQKSCYWEKTTCCTESVNSQSSRPPTVEPRIDPSLPRVEPYVTPPSGQQPPPRVDPYGTPPPQGPPQVNEGTSLPRRAFPPASAPTQPPPSVKLDRIAFDADPHVAGQVVYSDNAPRSNTTLLFVNAKNHGQRHRATTNAAGRFQAPLTQGTWWIYLENTNGAHGFHSRIEVNDQSHGGPIRLVSR